MQRPAIKRRHVRLLFLAILVLSGLFLLNSFLTNEVRGSSGQYLEQADQSFAEREQIVPPREGVTVVSRVRRPYVDGALVAFASDGRLLYYDGTLDSYFDVDPSPHGQYTVNYVASKRVRCSTGKPTKRSTCVRMYIQRVNLTTGEKTTIHTRVTHGDRWHDADRIGPTEFLIEDIANNRMYVLNTTTEMITWEWEAQRDFNVSEGGPFPEEWTHMNDVERISEGRYMSSLRNLDRVVFVDRQRGVLHNWTLGREDAYSILYEQHNPDYIPDERGGPAVVVSDSENNRVVEYSRRNGGWHRTWTWSDAAMSWPRDADRLPNNHTLITDSHGDRVVEVNEEGDIVWKAPIVFPYEAERLGTGDESATGWASEAAGLTSKGTSGSNDEGGSSPSLKSQFLSFLYSLIPFSVKLAHALRWTLPPWMHVTDALVAGAMGAVALIWPTIELWWRFGHRISVSRPIRFE